MLKERVTKIYPSLFRRRESAVRKEEKTNNYPYDAIVIMPYGSNLIANGPEIRPSFYSLLAMLAGTDLYKQGYANKIIIPSETVFGKEKKSTGKLLADRLARKFQVPEEDLIIGEKLNNTVFQLKYIKKLQKEKKLKKLLVVALDWHKERVALMINQMGINADVVEGEEILSQTTSANREKLLAVPMTKKLKKMDRTLRIITRIDHGLSQQILTTLKGSRVVDLHVNSTAKSVLKNAERAKKLS